MFSFVFSSINCECKLTRDDRSPRQLFLGQMASHKTESLLHHLIPVERILIAFGERLHAERMIIQTVGLRATFARTEKRRIIQLMCN